MRFIALTILLLSLYSLATQWQPPETVSGLDISGLNLNSDNIIMYGAKWHDGYWRGDSCYYIWNGSQWVWGDWVQGDVNTTEYDDEPFITHDGQHIYFTRWLYDGLTIYVADWDGSEFINSRALGPQINLGDNRYPSLTQDNLKLYYTTGSGSYFKIFEATWNGSDWNAGVLMPDAVNSSGNRYNVTITPDGNEIYFTGASPWNNRLAYSHKVGGVWQQWQYCDYNINPLESTAPVSCPAFSYSDYANQYLYFESDVPGVHHFRSLRSPVSVEPASLGQIKAVYK